MDDFGVWCNMHYLHKFPCVVWPPENLLLESGLRSPFRLKHGCLKVFSKVSVWGGVLPSPTFLWLSGSKQPKSKNIVSLRTARRWTIPNRGRYCLFPELKVPAVEMWRQKFVHGKHSHGKQAQTRTLADGLSFLGHVIWMFAALVRCFPLLFFAWKPHLRDSLLSSGLSGLVAPPGCL